MSKSERTIQAYPIYVSDVHLFGRSNGAGVGYMPHLITSPADEYMGVRFYDALKLGENKQVRFQPMYEGVDYTPLKTGVDFSIMEGSKVVGTGKITGESR